MSEVPLCPHLEPGFDAGYERVLEARNKERKSAREFCIDNQLVRIHPIIEMTFEDWPCGTGV